MKTARLVKAVDMHPGAWQALYRLSKPVQYWDYSYQGSLPRIRSTSFVIVSATTLPWDSASVETYIFASNPKGEVLSWSELDGSMGGVYDHELVLNEAGYTLLESVDTAMPPEPL